MAQCASLGDQSENVCVTAGALKLQNQMGNQGGVECPQVMGTVSVTADVLTHVGTAGSDGQPKQLQGGMECSGLSLH